MTHEELLEILQHTAQDGMADEPIFKALLAVVELHKPVGNSFNKVLNCRECKATEDEYNENWPCPTIQAIEKELK